MLQLSFPDFLFQERLPVARDFVLQLAAGAARFRKLVTPFIRPRRVDDGARIETFFADGNARIERPAPAAPQDFDGVHRLGARADCPDDFLGVGDVDVFIDNDDVASEIGAGAALACDHRRLARVAGIALLDRQHCHEAAA